MFVILFCPVILKLFNNYQGHFLIIIKGTQFSKKLCFSDCRSSYSFQMSSFKVLQSSNRLKKLYLNFRLCCESKYNLNEVPGHGFER